MTPLLRLTDVIATGIGGKVMTRELLLARVSDKLSGQLLEVVKTYDLHPWAESIGQGDLVATISVEDVAHAIKSHWFKAQMDNACIEQLNFYEERDLEDRICKLIVVIMISAVISPETLLAKLGGQLTAQNNL